MVALRHGAKDTIFDFSAAYDGIFFCFFSFLTHTLTQNGKKYTETAEPSLPESSRFCMQCCPKWPEMERWTPSVQDQTQGFRVPVGKMTA